MGCYAAEGAIETSWKIHLTHKAPITTAEDGTICNSFLNFQNK